LVNTWCCALFRLRTAGPSRNEQKIVDHRFIEVKHLDISSVVC
jgi:hypothetical protein